MNKLYCVPLGCSARKYFIDEIARRGWQDSVLVLPSGVLQARAYREGAVCVKNFDDISTELLNANGYTGLKRISRRTQELLVEELLQNYAQQQQLAYFNVLVEKKGFVKAVTSLLGQLSRSGAKMEEICETLSMWDRPGSLGLKDSEIAAVYMAYRTKLKQEGWFDVEGMYRLALYVLQQPNPVVPWRHLYFSEFYHFDGLQVELLKELRHHCGINIGLMYDAKRPEIFAAVENTFGDLGGFLDVVKLDAGAPQRAEDLTEFVTKVGTDTPVQNCRSIKLLEATAREQEIRSVLRSIKQRLLDGAECGDMVVFVRDFTLYGGLRSLSDEYGVPVSLPHSVKLLNEPLTEFVCLLLAKAEENMPGADAENLWKLISCQAVKLLFGFDGAALARLKAQRLYQSSGEIIAACGDLLAEGEAAEFARLLELLEKLPKRGAVGAYCDALTQILQGLQLAQHAGAAYQSGRLTHSGIKHYLLAAQQIEKILQQLQKDYEAGGLAQKIIAAQDFAAVFTEAAQGAELVLQRGDAGGVLMTEAANLQGVPYKYVYIMGLREGEFPALKTENWIYNDAERGELLSAGIDLPGTVFSLNEDRYFFYAAAAAATEELVLSYYKDEQGGASAYVEAVQKALAGGLKAQTCGDVTAAQALSPQELAASLALADRENAWLNSSFAMWQQRSGVDYRRAAGFEEYSGVLDGDALQAAQKKTGNVFSASRLETYAACPFRFLASYLWNLEEYAEADEGVAPADDGSLLHDVAARFIGGHFNKKLAACAVEDLERELRQIVDDTCAEYLQSGKLKDTVFLPYQKEFIMNRMLNFLKAELKYSEKWQGYKPTATELAFGPKTQTPLAVSGADGSPIYLQGRIDRIDADGGAVFVTDYKRGTPPKAGDMKKGADLQMPVYLLAAAQLFKDKEVSGGGYFSFAGGERSGGVFFAEGAKPPIAGAREKAADWQEFCRATEAFITGYVERMRGGDYRPLPQEACPAHCPARNICRRYGAAAAGGEANV